MKLNYVVYEESHTLKESRAIKIFAIKYLKANAIDLVPVLGKPAQMIFIVFDSDHMEWLLMMTSLATLRSPPIL